MNPMKNYYAPNMTAFLLLLDVKTSVSTWDNRTLDLNDFAALSIEESNLMVVLKKHLPDSEFPLVDRIISGYTNSVDAGRAFMSLWDAILRDESLWDVNVFNQTISKDDNP